MLCSRVWPAVISCSFPVPGGRAAEAAKDEALMYELPLLESRESWGFRKKDSRLEHGSLALDGEVVRKISKRHFFQDIIKSFQGATQLGLKLPQFFLFQKISTNTVARSIQIFGRYGPQQAGWLSNGQNFCIILAQSWDKEMLKISRRYLNRFLNNHQLTQN